MHSKNRYISDLSSQDALWLIQINAFPLQLSTKKTELQHIFQSIYDVHGFSEDCEKSIIHRLINSLLHIVRGVDSEKAMMAARCLGELGPSDLGTIVLKSDNDSKVYRLVGDLRIFSFYLSSPHFMFWNDLVHRFE